MDAKNFNKIFLKNHEFIITYEQSDFGGIPVPSLL